MLAGASLVGPPWEVQAKWTRSVVMAGEGGHLIRRLLPLTRRALDLELQQRLENLSKHAIDCTKFQ